MCFWFWGKGVPAQHTHTRTSWRENIRQNKQRKTGISEDALCLSDAISCALMIVFFSMLLLLSNLAHKLNYRLCPYVLKRGGFLFHKPAPSSSHHYYTTSLFRFTLIWSCVSFCVLCFCLFLRISNARLVNLCLPTLYMDPFNPFLPSYFYTTARSFDARKKTTRDGAEQSVAKLIFVRRVGSQEVTLYTNTYPLFWNTVTIYSS